MGEVYRAEDTRLNRTVAVKVLPEQIAGDPRLQQRFEREARALAGLSHPHICTLHDVGNEQGVRFLVMELLEGETLAARLEKGSLPFDQILRIGIDIADALDAAHRRGVVHRDVKPGNIMLTKAGVKLLDFGLAKDPAGVGAEPPTEDSPTATEHAPVTVEGAFVGTLRYMAPEQLEGGREADSRSDLFALGAVLYEMATGTRAFRGNSQVGLIAAILTAEPTPLSTRQLGAPPAFARVVDRCLKKDAEERWQSARDLMLELQWIAEADSEDDDIVQRPSRSPWPERIVWALALVVLAVVLTLVVLRSGPPVKEAHAVRLSLGLPAGATGAFARVSPDGRNLAFSIWSEGQKQLWLRPLDSLTAQPLSGTEDASFPFWSPDSRYVGFFADGKLKKIDVGGGPVQTLCDAPGPFSMGSWSRDGTILFDVTETPGQDGIYRVSDAGGTPERLRLLGESGSEVWAVWPSFLPDDRHFVAFCSLGTDDVPDEPGLCVASLDTNRARMLLPSGWEGGRAEYAPPGYLLYTRDGALQARAFDAKSFRFQGGPVTIAERLEEIGPVGLHNFSVSGDGVLVYQTSGSRSRLIWKDRNGREVGQLGSPGAYSDLRFGPDGRDLAVTQYDLQAGAGDVWIIEVERNVATRFTTDRHDNMIPVWSPDGRRVVYSSARDTPPFMHVKSRAGGDEQVLVPSRGTLQLASDWSSDGRHLLYVDRDPTTDWDIWLLPFDGAGEPTPFVQTPFKELLASFSPNGRWVAYTSDESGRLEIYVRSFEGTGERRRVSTGGGYLPRWRRDGKELFYLTLENQLMAVPVTSGETFDPGTPTALFSFKSHREAMMPYDVSPDGQRFIVISVIPEEVAPPTVVLDWTAELPDGVRP
jgi:serine/threonine protein kinase